jgi:SAM-dependent methyltransferase
MTATEDLVVQHYGNHHVLNDILAGLERAGLARDALRPDDLKPVDEFHTGGLVATEALLEQLQIEPETRVLDIGSGIGGTARYVAQHFGARVVGVDLTQEYVETARYLSKAVELGELTHFQAGSATDLPVMDETFDVALMLHVGMNIEDKAALFRSAARALCPGGQFGIFDIMLSGDASGMQYPVPWATRSGTSFLATPEAYRDAAAEAGFQPVAERDRRDFALDYFYGLFERIEREGPPILGIHLLMGETAGQKLRNYVANVEAGRITPCEMIFRKP